MAQRYVIETFGCQMNFHDSERMAGLLESAGYEAAGDPSEADVIVVNTCAVREKAEDKIFSRIGELRAEASSNDRHPVVAVVGCLAQQEGKALFRRSPFIDVVVGTQAEKRLPALLAEAARTAARQLDVNPYDDVSFPLGLVRRTDAVKAYVTIIEGCNDYCAYCVVPYTRGHERMRCREDVLAEVRQAAERGHREVQLLGQIVNHYQAPDDPACGFAELLAAVDAIPGIERIRFASPHPRHVTPQLIEAIADLPHVCKHLHLPVQSGSTHILEAMRRRHTREEYLALIDEARTRIPGIQFSTDMIVGFPGEGDAEFGDTLTLVEHVRFHSMFSFKYSERPNTLACKTLRDDVPEAEKTRRLAVLQERQTAIQSALHRQAIGSEVEVLVDSVSRRRETELSGRTTGNTVVNFPGPGSLLGTIVHVRVERAGAHSLWGRLTGEALTGPLSVPTL
jgi:tRNA-2-methylthio-N6-dimethylallyladenosine synthase